MKISLIMALSGVGLMALATILAYLDNRLFPGQMMVHHAAKGFPGIANGALWGNIFLMPFAFFCIGFYTGQWSGLQIITALTAGFIVSCSAFLFMYRLGLYDDAWAGAGEIHPAGWVAMVYTAGLIAALILFYVNSNVEWVYVLVVGGLLLVYILVANHVVLNALNEWRPFIWCPRVFAEEGRPMGIMIGGEILVLALTLAKVQFPNSWL